MSNFLDKILKSVKSEEDLYRDYFNKELWSIKEFAALMAGITPEKFEKIHDSKNKKVSFKEFDQYKLANRIYGKFVRSIKKEFSIEDFHIIKKDIGLSPWRYIEWMASHQIPIKKRFFKTLPLYLIELLHKFQPLETAVRTTPKWTRQYHESLYLQNAQHIMERSKKKLTRQEIYNDPYMEYIRRTFKDEDGRQVTYTKRTIIDSWLPKIDPQKRGRPPKNRSKI